MNQSRGFFTQPAYTTRHMNRKWIKCLVLREWGRETKKRKKRRRAFSIFFTSFFTSSRDMERSQGMVNSLSCFVFFWLCYALFNCWNYSFAACESQRWKPWWCALQPTSSKVRQKMMTEKKRIDEKCLNDENSTVVLTHI